MWHLKMVVMLIAVGGLFLPGMAIAMDKAELVDAIAGESKLTKADAGRALDAFVHATANKLKKGDRISLVGFGSFSISKRVASANGCDSEVAVDFSPSVSFNAKKEEGGRHTPFHNKIARIVPQTDGTLVVLGPNNGEAVRRGDAVDVYDRSGRIASGAVAGIVVAAVVAAQGNGAPGYDILEEGEGASLLGIVLGGVPPSALQVGGAIETRPPVVEDGQVGACPEGGHDGHIATDDEILQDMLAETRLPLEALIAAYNALLDNIIAAVNAGDVADLGDFGLFVEEQTISASVADDPCAGLPENCPPTSAWFQLDVSVQSGAIDDAGLKKLEAEVAGVVKRAARVGRNPQTGKEIKIAAKNVVRFKAGSELSGKVN